MARPKKPTIELTSLAECNEALGDLGRATSDLKILGAERDLAVAAAQAKFEDRMDEAKARKADLEKALEVYYYTHLAEVEQDGKKHVQLANGRIGRRDNPPKLRPLNRKWSWDAIENAVRALFGPKRFFRQPPPELDKEALKAAKLAIEELKQLGLKLEAEETFYAEPAALPGPEEVQGA